MCCVPCSPCLLAVPARRACSPCRASQEGLYYMSPASAICAWAVAAVAEIPHFPRHRFMAQLPNTWHLFVVNMLLGFIMLLAVYDAAAPDGHAPRARADLRP